MHKNIAIALTLSLLCATAVSAQISTSACFTVEEDNYGPVANDDYVPWPNGTVLIPALANDTDVDGDALVITALGLVSGGTATITDAGTTITFTPGSGMSSGSVPYTISDGQGHTSGATIRLTSNTGADFNTSCNGTFCTFTAIPFNTADIRSYTWDFGDASSPETRYVPGATHQYPYLTPSTPASYYATLSIDYLSGARAVVTKTVSMTGPPRQVTWSYRNNFVGCNQCLVVQATVTSSNLLQPTSTDEWRYFMNWGDGTQSRFQFGAHSSTYPAEVLAHTYATSGARFLELSIERWVWFPSQNGWFRVDGPYTFGGQWVQIVDQPPTVTFTATPSSSDPKEFTFNPQGSYDDTGLSNATHQLIWDFGDGTYATGSVAGSDPQPVTHRYYSSGNHRAKLTIHDPTGGHSTTAERQVSIANDPPVAVIWHGCSVRNGACSFTGLGSRDENNSIVSYEWLISGNGVNTTTSGRTVENWSLAPGCYDVKLTVTDEGGLTHSSTRTITVSNQPLAAGDVVVVDAHSSTYEWTTSPYGPLLRNTTGNLNGILEPGERVNVEPMMTTPATPDRRSVFIFPVDSTNPAVVPVIENNVPRFDQTAGVTDCWRMDGVDRMVCAVFGATVQGTRTPPHADFSFEMPRSEGSAENVTLKLHVGSSFTDVPTTAWYYADVESILHAGLTSGCGATTFCPDMTMPRDQVTVWLLRAKYGAAYTPPPCTSSPFPDVNCSTTPFAAWITQAWLDGIVMAYGDETFRPGHPVSRADLAAMIVRAVHGSTPIPRCTQDFTDIVCTSDPSTSHWAADYISELKRLGGTGGCGNGLFCPDTNVTRAEAAAFFSKSWKLSIVNRVCPIGTPVAIGAQAEPEQ
ncbi:MAG TPA: PKD domain-containing protein [Thermoanaerobaculia bacterium]|nr:PKD domain-containing protein [Thermoanaerobaculia bacterium]